MTNYNIHEKLRVDILQDTLYRNCIIGVSAMKDLMTFHMLLYIKLKCLVHTHSVRHCCPLGRFMSIAFLPVTSSTSTTPNEYTSAFSVICPHCAYSGPKYLHKRAFLVSCHFWKILTMEIEFSSMLLKSYYLTQKFQGLLFPLPCFHQAATLPVQNLQPETQKCLLANPFLLKPK